MKKFSAKFICIFSCIVFGVSPVFAWMIGIDMSAIDFVVDFGMNVWLRNDSPKTVLDDIIAKTLDSDNVFDSGFANKSVVHNLGMQKRNAGGLPILNNPNTPFLAGDAVVWMRRNGTVVKALVVNDFPAPFQNGFTAFEEWETALEEKTYLIQINITHPAAGVPGNIYTVANAPVSFGEDKWLVREGKVNSGLFPPKIGNSESDKWFKVNEGYAWTAQKYPAGSYVFYNNKYYRSEIETAQTPGENAADWTVVEKHVQSVPLWSAGAAYQANTVVESGGSYYISLRATAAALSSAADWARFSTWEEVKSIPQFTAGMYPQGKIVQSGGKYYYSKFNQNTSPLTNTSQWAELMNWDSLSSFIEYDPTTPYGTDFNGHFFRYNNKFYKKNGWVGTGVPPPEASWAWTEIKYFSDFFQIPVYKGSSTYQKYDLFYTQSGSGTNIKIDYFYMITNGTITSAPTEESVRNRNDIKYVPLYKSGTAYLKGEDESKDSYCYTIEGGKLRLWRCIANLGAGVTLTPAMWATYFREVTPNYSGCGAQTVVTMIGDKAYFWNRTNTAAFPEVTIDQAPSLTSSLYWTLEPNKATTQEFVSTHRDGELNFWRKKSGVASTTQVPGANEGDHWERIAYENWSNRIYLKTGSRDEFWQSDNAAAIGQKPAPLVAGWTLLNTQPSLQRYVYTEKNGVITFYDTRFIVGGVPSWRANVPAWTVPDNKGVYKMTYLYDASALYSAGDIVACGISSTNRYRYYKFIFSTPLRNRNPNDRNNSAYWQPVNILKTL